MISDRKYGKALRTFFAIALPDAARDECAGIIRALRAAADGEGVRWVRPESLHVTLRFLGNVATERVPEIVAAVTDEVASEPALTLRLGKAAVFPSARSPRVIALAVEPAEALSQLAARVETAVVAAGLAPERRAFRAHLSLGRVRNRRYPAPEGAPAPVGVAFPVHEVVLYRSDLEAGGAHYTALERIPLAGSPPRRDEVCELDHSP